MRKIQLSIGALALVSVVGIAGLAGAHAGKGQFSPVPDRVLTTAPEQLDLSFTEGLRSLQVEVYDANGDSVAGAAQIDPADPTSATVPLKPGLPAGSYTVKWATASVDGHSASGRYQFHITTAGAPDAIRVFVGGKEIDSEVPAKIVDGRTLLPVRAVAEALGKLVEWDPEQRFVIVSDAPAPHASHKTYLHPTEAPLPTIKLNVTPDTKSGFNLHIETTNWSWAPDRVNSEAKPNEGHGHLYIDGVKIGRLYGAWHHLDSLTPGRHEIKVTLNANDHSDYHANEHTLLSAQVTVVRRSDGARSVVESAHDEGQHQDGHDH